MRHALYLAMVHVALASWMSASNSQEACGASGECKSGPAADEVAPLPLVADRYNYDPEDPDPRRTWAAAPIKVSDDYLVISGEIVMDTSESPYMKRLAQVAGERGGRIMETGFGMGISARYIHEVNSSAITEHVIVEGNKEVYETMLLPFADRNQGVVTPRLGFHQDVTPEFSPNSFDAVLYDAFPVDHKDKATNMSFHHRDIMREVHRILKPGGVFTYLAEMETAREDKRHLLLAGFEPDDIQIDEFTLDSIKGDCKTYPHCNNVTLRFQVPRVVKSRSGHEL